MHDGYPCHHPCHDEHQVWYGSVEILYYTPETNSMLYVNWDLNRNFKKRNVCPLWKV